MLKYRIDSCVENSDVTHFGTASNKRLMWDREAVQTGRRGFLKQTPPCPSEVILVTLRGRNGSVTGLHMIFLGFPCWSFNYCATLICDTESDLTGRSIIASSELRSMKT
jgi:hypothetical protein